MKRILIFTLLSSLVFVLWSCGSGENPPPKDRKMASKVEAKTTETKPNPNLGKKIYKQYCALCHGKDGKLGVNGAGDLTASTISEAEVTTRIQKGKGLMTPFEEILSETQIKAVTEYVMAMRNEE
ncbi:MAG: c-type cytochrome [Chitinophagales bacterium]